MSTNTDTAAVSSPDSYDDVAATFDYDASTAPQAPSIESNMDGLDKFNAESSDDAGATQATSTTTASADRPQQNATADDNSGDVDYLRDQARQLGYTDEDVQSLDGDTLQVLIDSQSRVTFGMPAAPGYPQQQGWQQPGPPMPFNGLPGQPAYPQPGYQQPPQNLPSAEPYQVRLDPSEFDERMIGELTAMSQHYQTQLQQQQQMLMAMQQQQMASYAAMQLQRQQAMDEAQSRDFDRWIAGKGDAFAPLFGGDNITPNSPQHRARAVVYATADQMMRQAAASGVRVDANFIREQAARQVLGNQYDYFHQQASRQPAAKRQAQMTQRANGHVSRGKPRGADRAADTAERFFRERGL